MESASPDGPASLERLGRYQLVTEIGTSPLGALSAAYVSSGGEEGRIVAIRRVPVGSGDREAQQRISRAGIGAMSIRHARLAAVLDVMPGANSVAIVSEYMESASLRSVQRQTALARAPLPAPVAVAIAADVLRALRAARDLWRELAAAARDPLVGFVHGGLLPDSVMIATFGETMLADVGVAGAAARLAPLLEHPDALPYRAPEQLGGAIDERCDVYTVGVLLWEMLANRPLFGNLGRLRRIGVREDPAELKRQVQSQPIPRLDTIERPGPRIHPMLIEIVQEAVARNPEQRFPTLDALLDALRTLARDAIASPEQVSVAVDRLVRSDLESRRVAIEQVVGYDRVSVAPESARSTARPPPPEAPLRVGGPGKAFGLQEAPTLRRRTTPQPNTIAAVTDQKPAGPLRPPPPRAKAAPALGLIAAGATKPPPPPAPVERVVPAGVEAQSAALQAAEAPRPEAAGSGVRERTGSRDSIEPSGVAVPPSSVAPITHGGAQAARGRRRTVILVASVAALVVLGVLAMVGALGSREAAKRSTAKQPGSASPAALQSAPAAEPQAEQAPEAPAASEAPADEAPAAAPPSRRPEREIPRGAPAPGGGKKPYRPRGI